MGLWETCSSGWCPCTWHGGRNKRSLRATPTQTSLQFYETFTQRLPRKCWTTGQEAESSADPGGQELSPLIFAERLQEMKAAHIPSRQIHNAPCGSKTSRVHGKGWQGFNGVNCEISRENSAEREQRYCICTCGIIILQRLSTPSHKEH